jgi:ABC-type branched-subunit amino acid transport system substrate-binding protein
MTPQELNAKNSFPIDGGAQVATLFTTAYAMQSKVPTALLPADNPANLGLVKVIEATAKQAGGEFTAKVPIAANQTDYAPLVAAAQKNGTKAVLLQVSQPQAVQFIAAAEKAGAPFETYFMTASLNDDQVKQLGAEAVDKVIYATGMPLLNSDNPLVKQFNEDLKAYEDETGNKDAYAAGNGGIAPWLALNAIADALKQQNVTDITAKSVAEALRNTKDLDLQGVTPPWTPDKAGPEGMVRLSNTSYYLAGYSNGEPVLYTAQPVPFADAVQGTGLPAYPPKPAS